MPDHGDRYTARFIRFLRIPAHAEAYQAAYLDQSGSSGPELQRLHAEFRTLPPRHDCSCRCPQESRNYPPSHECKLLRQQRAIPTPPEYASRRPPDSTTPATLMLDLARALLALGTLEHASDVARYLNGPDQEAA